MEPTDSSSEKAPRKSGSRTFFIILAIIVVMIAAFLILRPNPTGTAPKNGSTSPAPTSSQ